MCQKTVVDSAKDIEHCKSPPTETENSYIAQYGSNVTFQTTKAKLLSANPPGIKDVPFNASNTSLNALP